VPPPICAMSLQSIPPAVGRVIYQLSIEALHDCRAWTSVACD
jgi:hypothetical protein